MTAFFKLWKLNHLGNSSSSNNNNHMCLAGDDEVHPPLTVFCQVVGGPSEPKRIHVQPADDIIRSVRHKATLFVDLVVFGGQPVPPGSTWDDMGIDDGGGVTDCIRFVHVVGALTPISHTGKVDITELDNITHKHRRLPSGGHGEYEGQCKDDRYNGVGRYKHPCGKVYEGEYKDGKSHGFGKLSFGPKGYDSFHLPAYTVFEGQFKDHKIHGSGTLTYPDGRVVAAEFEWDRLIDSYEGTYRDGKRHGFGKLKFADGTVYEGEFMNGEVYGSGKYTRSSGKQGYVGECKDGKFHGMGKYTFADGREYEGEYKDGQFHGMGRFTYTDGKEYEGEYKDGQFHGMGRFTYTDGTAYEGEYKDGKSHGYGKLTLKPAWCDRYHLPAYTVFEGQFKDHKIHGSGTLTYPDGRVVNAKFNYDRLIHSGPVQGVPLANAKADVTNSVSGRGMDVEEGGITKEIIKKMTETSKVLIKGRKKREVPAGYANAEQVASAKEAGSYPIHGSSKPGILTVAVDHKDGGNTVATGGADGDIHVFNKGTAKVAATLSGHKKKIHQVAIHSKQALVFSASADKTARVWAASGGDYATACQVTCHKDEVTGVSLHATGDYFVTSSLDSTWGFHDIATSRCLVQKEDTEVKKGFASTLFHPDGLILATGTSDARIRVWDIKAQNAVATFEGHEQAVHGLAFSENGYHMASCDGKAVKLWDLRKLKNFQTIDVAANSVAYDFSGAYLAVGQGKEVGVYNSKTFDVVATYGGHTGQVTGVAWDPMAHYLASTSMDRSLKFFSAQN